VGGTKCSAISRKTRKIASSYLYLYYHYLLCLLIDVFLPLYLIIKPLCHDLARDYLTIKHIDTHFDPIKHSNMFDSYHDLTRDHIIIRYANKNFKTTRIPDIRIRVLKYNYDYIIKIIVKVLI